MSLSAAVATLEPLKRQRLEIDFTICTRLNGVHIIWRTKIEVSKQIYIYAAAGACCHARRPKRWPVVAVLFLPDAVVWQGSLRVREVARGCLAQARVWV